VVPMVSSGAWWWVDRGDAGRRALAIRARDAGGGQLDERRGASDVWDAMCRSAPVVASRQKWRVRALVATTRGGRAWASWVKETGQQGRCCWAVDSLQLSQSGRAATSLSSAARSFVDAVGGSDQTAARGPTSSRAIRRWTDGCARVAGGASVWRTTWKTGVCSSGVRCPLGCVWPG
jgi:hypothetical protein